MVLGHMTHKVQLGDSGKEFSLSGRTHSDSGPAAAPFDDDQHQGESYLIKEKKKSGFFRPEGSEDKLEGIESMG
jgi:hypothetical protein